jgi:hypothetical protein
VPTPDAENPALVRDHSPAEFRDFEIDFQTNFLLGKFLDIVKMNEFASPLKIMNLLFTGAVRFLKDENILQQF